MTPLALLATVVGIFLGLAGLPQAIKIFKRKSAKDISAASYLIVEFGSLIWILYALELKNLPILIPNILGFATTTLILMGYHRYGRSKK